MKVRDVMTQPVLSVRPEAPVREVAALMLERRVSGVPVVDSAGRVLGVVSEGDFVRRPEIETEGAGSRWLRFFASRDERACDYIKTHGRTAADVMTAPAVTVSADAPVAAVAELMISRRIRRVPVVENDRLIGIIARADLLRAVCRHPAPGRSASDGEIRSALVSVIEEEVWAAGAIVDVQVSQGTVALWGSVESDRQREALILAAKTIPGVRAVETHLARARAG